MFKMVFTRSRSTRIAEASLNENEGLQNASKTKTKRDSLKKKLGSSGNSIMQNAKKNSSVGKKSVRTHKVVRHANITSGISDNTSGSSEHPTKMVRKSDEISSDSQSGSKKCSEGSASDDVGNFKLGEKFNITISESNKKNMSKSVRITEENEEHCDGARWESFGNSSGDEGDVLSDKPSSKESSSLKTRNLKRKLVIDRPRRSVRNINPKSYTEVRGTDSSSSEEKSDSSDSEKDVIQSGVEDSESDLVNPELEDEWSENRGLTEQGKEKSAKRHVKSSQNTNKRSSGTSKRKDSKDTKITKVSAPRTVKTTVKPWLKANDSLTSGDVVVPARTLSRGEKKMLEFRIFADSLLLGRNVEMTMEEAVQIVADLKARVAAKKIGRHTMSNLSQTLNKSSDVSSSEDEWEEMEPVDEHVDDKAVEVTINKVQEKNWWALYLRQEVNKRLRENWENAHRAHILCYIAHLQYMMKTVLDENLVPSLLLTQIPDSAANLLGQSMNDKRALKLVRWFSNEFKCSLAKMSIESSDCRFIETARFSTMVQNKTFETDADRAAILFALFIALECTARICINIQPMPRKWDETFLGNIHQSHSAVNERKLDESKSSSVSKKKQKIDNPVKRQSRNYWVEYWNTKDKKWICVDPLLSTVNDPNSMESNMTLPICYILSIDNENGVRDVTARYASDFMKPDFRRRRTDPTWIAATLKKTLIRANRERAKHEDLCFRVELIAKPLPTLISEYKNHPLYVLEKDLLKFEGIYPRPGDQKALGEIRGHMVYPRSTVYTLQSAKNWEKLARSVKEGERPYKIVKARPNLHVPAEKREQKYLDVFGFWQTEPFRREKVINGCIPRNEFGNVYMYQPSMCPIGAVHLRLPGLVQIARRFGKECAPAVVGWDFHNCGNYPIVEGACVLEEDVDLFINEWKRMEAGREEREEKRRLDRVLGNWRKLIRGILRLHYVKTRFGAVESGKRGQKTKKSKVNKTEGDNSAVIDRTAKISRQEFSHEEMMQL